jgi:hypothetical protein
MGFSLKSANTRFLAFNSPVAAADGGSSVPGPGSRRSGTSRGATGWNQVPEQGPRQNRARINRAPVLDLSRVEELTVELQSRSSFVECVSLFVLLLPHRVDSVVSALDGKDRKMACGAALSLAASAAMTGGRRLELVARLIDADLRAGRVNRARERGRRLDSDAAELASALSPLLTDRSALDHAFLSGSSRASDPLNLQWGESGRVPQSRTHRSL